MIFKPRNEPLVHGDAICPELKNFFIEKQNYFEHLLIPDLSYIDPLALNDKGIEILTVEYIADNRYKLHYQYDWYIFNGCAGRQDSGFESNSIYFSIGIEDTVNSKYGIHKIKFDLAALGHEESLLCS